MKSTSKLLEKPPKQSDDANKAPFTAAEVAVQKLQMNNSVSIISKKVSSAPSPGAQQSSHPTSSAVAKANDTIDLSNDNDDDTPVICQPTLSKNSQPTEEVKFKPRPTILKCPIKKCDMRFSNVRALRDHSLRVHQLARLNKFKCTICSTRFPSTDAVKAHIHKVHANKVHVNNDKSEFGIPIVNFNDPNIRKKMLSLGFTNFLPITNARNENAELFGMPIININGPSINNLKNLFDTDCTKILPISSMRTIARPQSQTSSKLSASSSSASSTALSFSSSKPSLAPPSSQSSVQITAVPSPQTAHTIQTPRTVPKLLSAISTMITHPTEPTLSALLQKPKM